MTVAKVIERLIERARNRVPEDNPLGMTPADFLEGQAANALASAQEEIARLRDALKPFAEAAAHYEPDEGDDRDIAWAHDFTIGSLRRSARSLSPSDPQPPRKAELGGGE